MFYISKKPLYFNKSLRDYLIQSINDSVKKIVERNENYKNDTISILINTELNKIPETHVLQKNNKLLPFGIFMCIYFILYSNKK